MIVHARVRSGRFVIEEPTDLPDGTEVTLEVVEDVLDAEMPKAERAELERSIATAREQWRRGEGIDGDEYLAKLTGTRR